MLTQTCPKFISVLLVATSYGGRQRHVAFADQSDPVSMIHAVVLLFLNAAAGGLTCFPAPQHTILGWEDEHLGRCRGSKFVRDSF